MGGPFCLCTECKAERNKRYAKEEKERERVARMIYEIKNPPEDFLDDILP